MEKKTFVCSALLCLLFLHTIQAKKLKENVVEKQCLQQIGLQNCDDKQCFGVCKKQFATTQLAFCLLPTYPTCQCYYACDKGPVVDCSEKLKLEGCNNPDCYRACVDNVEGAVSGSCLDGNHICKCEIPCAVAAPIS